jgi:hypothetical protein
MHLDYNTAFYTSVSIMPMVWPSLFVIHTLALIHLPRAFWLHAQCRTNAVPEKKMKYDHTVKYITAQII